MSFGHGPWYVVLIEDVGRNGQTEIFIHTYPENVVTVKNLEKSQCWFIHFYVGPFSYFDECVSFYKQWSKSKQLKTRLDHGYKLFNEHKDRFNLYLYKVSVASAAATTNILFHYNHHYQPQEHHQQNYITIEEIKSIANKRVI
jgi:hypothetical protein